MLIPKGNTPRWIIFFIDVVICLFSLFVAYLLRFDFVDFPIDEELPVLIISLPVFLIVRMATFYFGKTYQGIVRYTSTQDSKRIFIVVTIGTLIFFLLSPVRFLYDGYYLFPMSILIMDYFVTIFLMITARIAVKLLYAEQVNPSKEKTKIIIYGAGEMGLITKRALDRDTASRYKVAGFIDDNEKMQGKMLEGVKIFHTNELSHLLKNLFIEQVVVAIRNPDIEKKTNVINFCMEHNVQALTVPPVQNWINGELNFKQIKKVKIDDLLGRKPIKLDEKNISATILNKTVLVTGAAGSIGSEIVRQVVNFNPSKIILLDQAESALYDFEMELISIGKNKNCEIAIGDITQPDRMERLFSHFRPQVIFHAAAYKHVPLMEENPTEAVNTNVYGTKVLVDLAIKYNAERFVMVSTDKAVNPTNVMGASKRVAEIYTQSAGKAGKTKFITTRFGNVLGSNGSVIPLFEKQIENGGPLTITHPDVTRYFMTIPEACQLVLEAGAMGNGGEVFVFDMGKSMKIIDLARNMIRLSGFEPDKDIKIKITGLRPGEKLYEEVLSDAENTLPTHNNQVLIAKVREYDRNDICKNVDELIALFSGQDNFKLVAKMKEIVPEFKSNNSIYEKLD